MTRATALGRDLAYRVRRRVVRRWSDLELRQLRTMQRAYGTAPGPPVLMFGDSAIFWTTPGEADRRHLADMIHGFLPEGTEVHGVAGQLYNARIVMAYLSAFEHVPGRPRAVIVPLSVITALDVWLAHPKLGWERGSAEIKAVIDGSARLQKLTGPTPEELETFHRLPSPSLFGARRTVGEAQMITHAKPETRWQHVVRLRHLIDYYNAQRLEAEDLGPRLIREMGAMLAAMEIPAIGYIPPVNCEVAEKLLGEGAADHIVRNAELVATAFAESVGSSGTVVNSIGLCGANEFSDPIHLTDVGRRKFASAIAEAVRPSL